MNTESTIAQAHDGARRALAAVGVARLAYARALIHKGPESHMARAYALDYCVKSESFVQAIRTVRLAEKEEARA